MRKLAMSDIHGHFYPMVRLLKHVGYNPAKDRLTIIGDMIDRGPDSLKVLNQLYSLHQRHPDNVNITLGNHEHMMGMYLGGINIMWLNYGGLEVRDEFHRTSDDKLVDKLDNILVWAISRPWWHVDSEYVYVHAGLDPASGLTYQDRKGCVWMPHLGYELEYERFRDTPPVDMLASMHNRKVIYGHTPRGYVYDDGARICIDRGAGVKSDGMLALVDLTNDTVYETWAGTGDIADPHYAHKVFEKKIARKKV